MPIPTTEAEVQALIPKARGGDRDSQYAIGQYYKSQFIKAENMEIPDSHYSADRILNERSTFQRMYLSWTTMAAEGPDGLFVARLDLGDYYRGKGVLSCVVDSEGGKQSLAWYRQAATEHERDVIKRANALPFAYAIDHIARELHRYIDADTSLDPKLRGQLSAGIIGAAKEVLISYAPSPRHSLSSGLGYVIKIASRSHNPLEHLRVTGIQALADEIMNYANRSGTQKSTRVIVQEGVRCYVEKLARETPAARAAHRS